MCMLVCAHTVECICVGIRVWVCVWRAHVCMCVNLTPIAGSVGCGEARLRREARGEAIQIFVLTCMCGIRLWALSVGPLPAGAAHSLKPYECCQSQRGYHHSIMHGLYSQNQSLLMWNVRQSEVGGLEML